MSAALSAAMSWEWWLDFFLVENSEPGHTEGQSAVESRSEGRSRSERDKRAILSDSVSGKGGGGWRSPPVVSRLA